MKKTIKKFIFISIIAIIITNFILITNNIHVGAYALNEGDNNSDIVFLGGNPIGIISDSKDGLVVTEVVNITTESGSFSPALKAGIKKGDLIFSANGEKIYDIESFNKTIESSVSPIILGIIREDKGITITIEPVFDLIANRKKIGLMLKNNIAGIGTLTYVTKSNNFGALGHQIVDGFGHGNIYKNGLIFLCDITGYKVAISNTPGELIGKINTEYSPIGTISENKFCGIFGEITDDSFPPNKTPIEVGSKDSVMPGKAYICTTINGSEPQRYEIEIVKTFNQTSPNEKSMVLRITDKRLLSTTKGILQGMSGSPIIQNDKLIGAVTHVFTNDSTMGYGIYIDWMLPVE